MTCLRTLADFHHVKVDRQLRLSENHPDSDRCLIGNQFRPGQDIRIGRARGINKYCACSLGGGRKVWVSALRPRITQKLKQTCEDTLYGHRWLSMELGRTKKIHAGTATRSGTIIWRRACLLEATRIICIAFNLWQNVKSGVGQAVQCYYLFHKCSIT